jgi:lipoyl(octanoyl) transferase
MNVSVFYQTKRGGQITFHGPGQLVCYPIINLQTLKIPIRTFVYGLEESIIKLCSHYNICSERSPNTGVWVGNNKICAIGLQVTRDITSHGLALNCDNDLTWFDHIVPCGIVGKGVTSLSKETGRIITTGDVKPLLVQLLQQRFDIEVISQSETKAIKQ